MTFHEKDTSDSIRGVLFAGYYCRIVGCKGEALQHFLQAAGTSDSRLDVDLAIVEASLTLLDPGQGHGGSEKDVLQAIDLLKNQKMWMQSDQDAHAPRDK